MTKQVHILSPEASVLEAAQIMDSEDVGSVPICDGDKVVGILTDRDITVNVVAKGLDYDQVQARDIMTSPVIYAFEDQNVEEAGRIMEANQVRRLVVLNRDKRMVGFVALGDLATKTDPTIAGETLEEISEPNARVA